MAVIRKKRIEGCAFDTASGAEYFNLFRADIIRDESPLCYRENGGQNIEPV